MQTRRASTVGAAAAPVGLCLVCTAAAPSVSSATSARGTQSHWPSTRSVAWPMAVVSPREDRMERASEAVPPTTDCGLRACGSAVASGGAVRLSSSVSLRGSAAVGSASGAACGRRRGGIAVPWGEAVVDFISGEGSCALTWNSSSAARSSPGAASHSAGNLESGAATFLLANEARAIALSVQLATTAMPATEMAQSCRVSPGSILREVPPCSQQCSPPNSRSWWPMRRTRPCPTLTAVTPPSTARTSTCLREI
eukprot:scaffold3256_cov114-Isochrysis_galbana.AAC.21